MSEPTAQVNCIYCGAAVEPGGVGDHVLPARFGEFRCEFLFKRICSSCNSAIGACEEQIIRTGPESDHLAEQAPSITRSQRGRSRQGASGARRPRRYVAHGSHLELVHDSPTGVRDAVPIDQLVIVDVEGVSHNILLFPGMTPDAIRRQLTGLTVPESPIVRLHASDETWPTIMALLRSLWPEMRIDQLPSTEPGTRRTQLSTHYEVTTHYFRGIAKIGFHYFLATNSRGVTGAEGEFDGIREFIRHGGTREEFVASNGERPSRWTLDLRRPLPGVLPNLRQHVLFASDEFGRAIAQVHLFVGTDPKPAPYEILLGAAPRQYRLGAPFAAHAYRYRADGKSAGHVSDLANQIRVTHRF